MRCFVSQRDLYLKGFVIGQISLVLLGLVTLSGCSDKGVAAKPQKGKEAVPVKITTVTQKTIPQQIRAIGNVEVISSVSVKAQISGELTRVYFQAGQDVKKGDLLFQLDSRSLEAALMQAKANLAKDMAQIQQAEAKWRADVAQIKQAQANQAANAAQIKTAIANLNRDQAQASQAAGEAQRYASLLKAGAISKNQYEQLRAQAESSRATANAGRSGIENAQASARASSATVENAQATASASQAAVQNARAAVLADDAVIESAKSVVKADLAAIENAKVQLGFSSIYAPIDGRTGSLQVTQGNLVKANDTTSLVVINQIHPIAVNFAIPQQKLSLVRQYMATGQLKVEAIVAKDEQHPVQGVLTFIDNAVDNATGTVKLKATFDNLNNKLWPGQFVNVVLELSQDPNAIAVASQAVQTGQDGQYVFVVNPDMSVKMQPVTVDRTVNGEAVIAKGLQAGEKVVIDGTLRLVPGSKVKISDPKAQGQQTEGEPKKTRKGGGAQKE